MIRQIVSRGMQENCYMIIKDNDCILIDPGERADVIIHILEQNNLTPKAILLTHGHYDHIQGVDGLVDHYQCQVYAGALTAGFVKDPDLTLGVILKSSINSLDSKLNLLDMEIMYIPTPGHTIDSGIYYFKDENALFTGDTLFQRSIGRTDLPTGDLSAMWHSLRLIAKLPFNAYVFPGHGPSTTLADEIQMNMYIQEALRQD